MTPRDETTYFVISIDTETYKGNGRYPDFQANLYGKYKDDQFGVQKIMDISDRYGAKSTFFVDVYMHYFYGKPRVKEFCRHISAQGHDVQLHAHPAWLPGSHSGFLYDFPLSRQVEILREGRNLIGDWTGSAPIAFRAGSYSANLDTIRALEETDFRLDSSYFAYRPSCRLSSQLKNAHANRPFYIRSILELPVTAYWMINHRLFRKVSKLDFNACSLAELTDVVPQMVGSGIKFIVLFLHSFSFIRWNKDFTSYSPNHHAIARFEGLLKQISAMRHDVRFCTMQEAAHMTIPETENDNDFVPTVGFLRLFPRALQRAFGH